MAHRGYTLAYFINYFSNTTNAQWNSTTASSLVGSSGRQSALEGFGVHVSSIAAGNGAYAALGVTPRGRVLRALRNRKRTGNVLGANS